MPSDNRYSAGWLGAPVGGLLRALGGLHGVVVVDCVSFLLAAALVAPIRAPRRVAAEGGADVALAASAGAVCVHEWREGMRLIRVDRTLLVLFGALGLMTFGGTMLDPLSVAWDAPTRSIVARPSTPGCCWTHAVCGIVGARSSARSAGALRRGS